MSGGTETSSFDALVVRRLPRLENAPWSHGTKLLLWVGLASASWAVVIAVGYFIWSVL